MLRFFRSGGVAQVLVGGIVFAIILVFVVEFRAGRGPLTAGLTEQCAISFDGYCVDGKEYAAAYSLVAPRGLDPKAARNLGLRKTVLDGLVERELLIAQAKKLGLGVSDDALTRELELGRAHVSLPAHEADLVSTRLGLCRLEENGRRCEPGATRGIRQLRVRRTASEPFDYKLYEREIRILANRGPREFRQMQKRELLAERMRELVRSRVRVSDAEARFVAQRAVVRTARLDRSWFAKYVVDTSDAAVDRFGFEQRAQIDAAWNEEKANWTAGCPRIREVLIPMPPLILDDDKNPLREKAEAARKRLVAGESFARVAAEVSAADSAELGGEAGCLSKASGIGAEELLKAVEPLKPGEISPVIETPRGYHVVQLIERVEEPKLEETGRRHLARRLYVKFAADEAARRFADTLIERTKGGAKLEELVRTLSEEAIAKQPAPKSPGAASAEPPALVASDRPKFEVSPPFARSGNPLPTVAPKESLAARAFELETPDAVYAKPIETDTGFVVLQLKELAAPEEYEKDKAEALEALRHFKSVDALTRYVADLRRKAGDDLRIDPAYGNEPAEARTAE